ncbi:unnamed protein product, partial [Musa textilis]
WYGNKTRLFGSPCYSTPVLGEDASMELPQQSCHLRRWKIEACSKLILHQVRE